MKTIEIVTHAYAEVLPHYAACLNYQLSSLWLHPPKECQVEVTVCYCTTDQKTKRVLDWFYGLSPVVDGVSLNYLAYDRQHLGRRCIGRNDAALETAADIVWFTDVDHVFRDGVLDSLANYVWDNQTKMVYPQTIQIHRDHATGDQALAKAVKPGLIDIDPVEFVNKQYNRAIGGIQIVDGDFARCHGYLDQNARYQRPTSTPFGDFKDDVSFRHFCEISGDVLAVDLPGVYRLRHSTTSYQ
jgi:hypothetical protein